MKATIYVILNSVDQERYIGSTTQPINIRFSNHQSRARIATERHSKLYQHMRLIGIQHFFISSMLEIEVQDRTELLRREGYYIRVFRGSLNTNIAGRTKAEYKRDNADRIKKYNHTNADSIKKQQAEYRRDNADRIKEQKAEYIRTNADRIKEQKAEYRRTNADRIKEQKAEYYRDNVDRIKKQQGAYYKLHKNDKPARCPFH